MSSPEARVEVVAAFTKVGFTLRFKKVFNPTNVTVIIMDSHYCIMLNIFHLSELAHF